MLFMPTTDRNTTYVIQTIGHVVQRAKGDNVFDYVYDAFTLMHNFEAGDPQIQSIFYL